MDTYSYGWVVDYANLRCGEKRFATLQYYAMPANLKSLANRIQRKTVILYWGHHAQLTKQSRSEFSQAPKNAAMRSCRGIAIVCTIRRVKKTDEMNKVILIFIRYTNVYTHTHMCGTVSPGLRFLQD